MADLEYLDRRPGRPDLEAERIAVTELGARHLLLARPERVDRADRIAQLRRLLEALGLGRFLHPIPQRLDQHVVPSREEQLRVLDGDAVVLG